MELSKRITKKAVNLLINYIYGEVKSYSKKEGGIEEDREKREVKEEREKGK